MALSRSISWSAIALSGWLVAAPALAQPVDADEAAYALAQQLRRTNPDAALTMYQAIAQRTHSPRSLVQLGQLEAQLGRWVRADEHLAVALASTGDAWLEPRRAALAGVVAEVQRHVSEFTVVANVPGAHLRLNGEARGVLPLATSPRVTVGPVVIDVEASGYEPLRQTAEATPGRTRVEVTLVPRRAREVPPAVERPVAEPALMPMTLPDIDPVVPAAPTEVRRSPWGTVGAVTLAAGGVGLGLGVIGLLLRNGHVETFSQQGCWLTGGSQVMGAGGCQADYDAGVAMQTMATAGFVGGGVLAAAGVAVLVLAGGAGRGGEQGVRRRVSVQCGMGPGTIGASCGGVW